MTKTRLCIVYLEDDPHDVELLELSFACAGVDVTLHVVKTREEFLEAMKSGRIEAIMSDCGLPEFPGRAALEIARDRFPEIPFVFLSGHLGDEESVEALRRSGALDCVEKSRIQDAVALVQSAVRRGKSSVNVITPPLPPPTPSLPETASPLVLAPSIASMKRLIQATQELALARRLEDVQGVVRRAARELTRADGASFILREGDQCHYVDENAITPLWKGQRFPMTGCVSGWVMLHRRPVVIEDIYTDTRIPTEAYRPTFVKSMAMVPIRTLDPIGAIGIYWGTRRRCAPEQLELLHALADSTAVTMENVRLWSELEQKSGGR